MGERMRIFRQLVQSFMGVLLGTNIAYKRHRKAISRNSDDGKEEKGVGREINA
jgi:hypothetical protein